MNSGYIAEDYEKMNLDDDDVFSLSISWIWKSQKKICAKQRRKLWKILPVALFFVSRDLHRKQMDRGQN